MVLFYISYESCFFFSRNQYLKQMLKLDLFLSIFLYVLQLKEPGKLLSKQYLKHDEYYKRFDFNIFI